MFVVIFFSTHYGGLIEAHHEELNVLTSGQFSEHSTTRTPLTRLFL